MSKYRCKGCPCECEAVIDDACDFEPTQCLDKQIADAYDCDWDLITDSNPRYSGGKEKVGKNV